MAKPSDLTSVGGAGQAILEQNLESLAPAEIPAFLGAFREANKLRGPPDLDAVVQLLGMGGLRRQRVQSDVFYALRAALLERIRALGAARDYTALQAIFDDAFFNIRVEWYLPIVVAIFDAGEETVVDEDIWASVDHMGYGTEAVYHFLPTRMKACMWMRYRQSLDHEVFQLLRGIPDFNPPSSVDEINTKDYYKENGRNVPLVGKLITILKAAKKKGMDAFGPVLDIFVRYCTRNAGQENKCVAIADLLLDFLTHPIFALLPQGQFDLQGQASDMYTHCVSAANIITTAARENTGGTCMLQLPKINLLQEWLCGRNPDARTPEGKRRPTSIKLIALMLHSSLARTLMTTELTERLLKFSRELSKARLNGSDPFDRLMDESAIIGLTHLASSTIKAMAIMESGHELRRNEWEGIVSDFYPQLLGAMVEDDRYMKQGSRGLVEMPDERLAGSMRTGVLERRIFCTHAFILHARFFKAAEEGKALRSLLSRLSLILDQVFGIVAAGTTLVVGEEREKVLCETLLGYALLDDDDDV